MNISASDLSNIGSIATLLISTFFPEAGLFGITAEAAAKIISGVISGVPSAVALYDTLTSGEQPTQAQIDQAYADSAAAHSALQASADAVIAKG